MARLTLGEAHALVVGALMAHRTSADNAESVARALVGAELAGQPGHGLSRVAAYAAQARSGKVDGFSTPLAERRRPGALAIDAATGFAYPALDLAVGMLPEMARANGVAMAGVRRSHHAGAAGLVAERLAAQGLVALMFANSPAAMAPWGAATPLFGTNPIAFAAPVEGADPVVIDLSLSKVARGKVMIAAQKGEPIPEGWALDAAGAPTRDASAALKGAMLPMGDAKGAALALMVELLCGAVAGANFAFEATSFFDEDGEPPGVGQMVVALDPTALAGPAALARIAVMARAIEAANGARLPGRRRAALAARMQAEGIEIAADLHARLEALRESKPRD